jgi:hypothetical protein
MIMPAENTYYDHPQPSRSLQAILALFFLTFLAGIGTILLTNAFTGYQGLLIGPMLILESVILYAFWLIDNVSYQIGQAGISVKFGSVTTDYTWDEFQDAYWKKGIFALKIGWHRISPCVRLRSAVVLRRTDRRPPLNLTPSDPGEFLEYIAQIQPRLVEPQD